MEKDPELQLTITEKKIENEVSKNRVTELKKKLLGLSTPTLILGCLGLTLIIYLVSFAATGSADLTAGRNEELTFFPTISPSTTPIVTPSHSPSTSPTMSPSTSPTTSSPSLSPTKLPSFSPTTFPSNSPSVDPTRAPSTSPTVAPTGAPSTSPTTHPTMNPSIHPTRVPSFSPTVFPTAEPTATPTQEPTRLTAEIACEEKPDDINTWRMCSEDGFLFMCSTSASSSSVDEINCGLRGCNCSVNEFFRSYAGEQLCGQMSCDAP
eukprot:augustus_masked-scaffold_75-processed-gene-0.9-mRNA-1 protein AED:0.52 eAED:0.52 QI:0/-1/0/1/-1/1/1/0/264